MTHAEARVVLNLKVGDEVLVTHRTDELDATLNSTWVNRMDYYIGKVGVIYAIESGGIVLKFKDNPHGREFYFSAVSLERIDGSWRPSPLNGLGIRKRKTKKS